MRKKVFAAGLVLVLAAGMIAGCGKKAVDYSLEEDSEKGEVSASADLEQYKGVADWKDEWKVTDAGGVEQTVSVNAAVDVPDTDSMSVVEIESVIMDVDFRKNFLKCFFGGGEVYYHDEEHYTTAEIEKDIADLEAWLTEPDTDADTKSSIKDILEEKRALLEHASDEYTAAETFGTCRSYIGYKDDVCYAVSFSESEADVRPYDGEYYGPEALRDYRFVEEMSDYEAGAENEASNACSYSMDEAQRIAEDFMTAVGRSGQICVEKKPVMWHGWNTDANAETAEEEYQLYGYTFVYGSGVGDIAFAQFPDRWNYDVASTSAGRFVMQNTERDSDTDSLDHDGVPTYDMLSMFTGDRVEITITDRGVISARIVAPVKITDITEAVDLLPLDTVESIIKNELAENGGNYNFEWMIPKYNNMKLMYLKLQNDVKKGLYTYVPVWCLSYKDEQDLYYHPVFVNAISGNVIDIMDIKVP